MSGDTGDWGKVVYNSVLVTPGGGKCIVGPLGGVVLENGAQQQLNTGNGQPASTTINRGMPDPVKFAGGVLKNGR